MKSREKLKRLCLHYHNANGHKTRKDGDLPWVTPTIISHEHIITLSCNITWQTRITTYPLAKCLWLSILAGWDIQWGAFFHKITRFVEKVFLQVQVNYFSSCITPIAKTMTFKLGKVVIYYTKIQPRKSHNPLNEW